LKNFAIETNYYILIFGITQLIDSKKRAQEIYKTTIYFINKVIAQKSTTFQHAFDNEILEIENIEKKNINQKRKRDLKDKKSF